MGKKRSRSRKPKTPQSIYKHFERRFVQRYNMSCTMAEFYEMSRMVREGFAEHIDKQSCTRSHFRIIWKDTTVRVVYDTKRQLLITALPEHAG